MIVLQSALPTSLLLFSRIFIAIFACLFFYINLRINSPSFRKKKGIAVLLKLP